MEPSLFRGATRLMRSSRTGRTIAALAMVCLMANARGGMLPERVVRLRFASGKSRISVTGLLGMSRRRPVYSLYARAGQRLKVDLRDQLLHGADAPHLVSMYHITFPSGKTYGTKGYDAFDGRLTETGLYRLYVEMNQMASNRTTGRYRLTLTR